ncbi:c-Myc-binding protein homolog [Lutzomyia longipalpis]|uniref:c-Myc-binding protein homolog n=1 Tax=Lutzomyia longipalpis TaxID=7200 RepID=UPI00248469CD|nr:c-Myc-binding protein homolog [Lutzomyia longipalpis]
MAYKPIDSRRDDYRKFLERNGVMETLTKVLCKLMLQYEKDDNKDDAIDFIRKNLGDAVYESDVITSLRAQLEESRKEIEDLKRQIQELKDGGAPPANEVAAAEEVAQEKVNSPREAEPVVPATQEEVKQSESVEAEKMDVSSDQKEKEEKSEENAAEPATEEVAAKVDTPAEVIAETTDAAKDDTPASPPAAEAEVPKDAPSAVESPPSKEAAAAEGEKA